MNETTQAGKDRRHARLDALTGTQRAILLAWLCGAAPEAVDAALDFAEDMTAQPAEGNDGDIAGG